MAGATGLEPATSCVTGRRSNQLNYAPAKTTTDDFHVLRRPSRTCTALRVTGQRSAPIWVDTWLGLQLKGLHYAKTGVIEQD